MGTSTRIFVTGVAAALLLGVCNRSEGKESPAPASAAAQSFSSKGSALPFSQRLIGDANPTAIAALNQASLAKEGGQLEITATGEDAQIALPQLQTSGSEFALRVEINAPAATSLQVYYQTTASAEFSGDRVITAALKKGANSILLHLGEPQFNGRVRLDPGQVAGNYVITALEAFSTAPLQVARAVPTQEELGKAFAAKTTAAFTAATVAELKAIEPLKDVKLLTDRGFIAHATGTDPSLLLPEFNANLSPLIVRLDITSPAPTVAQLFYLKPGQRDYVGTQMSSQPLKAGKNVVYLEIPETGWTGRLRLDPGTVEGDYAIERIEAKAVDGPATP